MSDKPSKGYFQEGELVVVRSPEQTKVDGYKGIVEDIRYKGSTRKRGFYDTLYYVKMLEGPQEGRLRRFEAGKLVGGPESKSAKMRDPDRPKSPSAIRAKKEAEIRESWFREQDKKFREQKGKGNK